MATIKLLISLILIFQLVTSQTPIFDIQQDILTINNVSVNITAILNQSYLSNVGNNSNVLDLASVMETLSDLYAQMALLENLKNISEAIEFPQNECSHQLGLLYDGAFAMDDWALRMLDASAKFQSGFLEGNIMQLGNYEECLKINTFINETQLVGKYCTAGVLTNANDTLESYDKDNIIKLKLSYGFCIPAVCDDESITEIASRLGAVVNSSIRFQFLEELCSSSVKANTLPVKAILSITFFALVGVVVVLSTLYDIFIYKKKMDNGPNLLMAFSFYTNGKKLLSLKTSSDSLKCLNGLRVISIMWIIGGHRYMYAFLLPLTNLSSALKWEEYYEGSLISSANLAVDTFFVISGLLIVYVYLNHKEKGQNMPTTMFYLHRILRLTPSLAAVVLFYTTLYSHVGSGPLWFVVYQYFQRPCEQSWWWTLLYLQNYIHPNDEACVDHSWYLAVDTQLYFLSPLLLFPLVRWPKRTVSVIFLLVVLCSVVTFGITWQRKFRPAFYGLDDTDLKVYLYWVTHVRASPWLIGFALGYAIFRCKNRLINIHKVVVVLLWLSSTGLMLGIILYHGKISAHVEVTLMQSAICNSLIRTLWALAVSVIIFLCVTGYGGFINRILSGSIFTILIRVNYSMYLLHNMVVIYDLAQKRTPDHLSPRNLFYLFWGDFVITLSLAFVWTLTFESPILVLEKLIFGKKKKRAPVNSNRQQIMNNNFNVVIIDNKIV